MNFKTLFISFHLSSLSFAICNQLELDKNLPTASFRHSKNTALTRFAHHHSASDVITVTGHEANINAKFSYGPLSQDLEDEDVEVWIDTCENKLIFLGVFQTDSDGRVRPTFSANQLPREGTYQVWMRVIGDNTSTQFTLRILKPNTLMAIFDFDGTLTHSNLDSNTRTGAPELTHVLKDSNREIVYLSGRHYFLTNWTRKLLRNNQFAEGSLIVGQSLLDVIPIDASVGEFKTTYLKYLRNLGLVLERGYGNHTSDIYAYQEAQIPNTQIFILGSHGGINNTVALGEDFLQHLKDLLVDLSGQHPIFS